MCLHSYTSLQCCQAAARDYGKVAWLQAYKQSEAVCFRMWIYMGQVFVKNYRICEMVCNSKETVKSVTVGIDKISWMQYWKTSVRIFDYMIW